MKVSIEGLGHLFTIYFPGFVCFVLYKTKISGERLEDHWSSGCFFFAQNIDCGYTLERPQMIGCTVLSYSCALMFTS